jgi:allophanate hydrolase subunit 2
VTRDGRPAAWSEAIRVEAGEVLEIGPAVRGQRSYLAVDGGFTVPPVLGSRSADLLSGLGPPALGVDMALPLGATGSPGTPGPPAVAAPPGRTATLRVWPGPRDDWLATGQSLVDLHYTVSPVSNRIGLRLSGPALGRRPGELASEATVTGAVQVPADGVPLIFLADHPTTVGYPIVAVVDPRDLPVCAQLRPGTAVTFTTVPGRRWRSVLDS